MEQGSLSERWENSIAEKEGTDRPGLNLDSTALLDVTNNQFHAQRNLTLSPILRPRSPKYYASRDSFALLNEETNQDLEDSQFGGTNDGFDHCSPSTSTPSRATRSSVYNPFEKHLVSRLMHNAMSPSIFESLENMPPTPETPCSKSFSWSIEQMALLKPAEITDQDIADSALSPDPVLEAQYRAAADVYLNSGVLYVPSPEGPRPMFLAKTPLVDMVRLRAARLAAAAGSMSKAHVDTPVSKATAKRRSSSLRLSAQAQKRHCATQTTCTIGPNVDFDFASILGESSVFQETEVEPSEEFDSNSSIGSLRRRLFAEEDDSCLSEISTQDPEKSYLRADLDGSLSPTSPGQFFPGLSPIRCTDH